MVEVGLHAIHARYSTAFCGFCEPEHLGRMCRSGVLSTKRAIADSNNGFGKVFASASFLSWPRICTSTAALTSVKRSSIVPSRRQKGGSAVGKTRRGKGTKIMAIADAAGLPIATHIEGASLHEVKLVEPTIDSQSVSKAPRRLIGDKAYDSNRLDRPMSFERNTEMIAPHKGRRKKSRTQHGRKLRRYK
jgi:hypothetical protein